MSNLNPDQFGECMPAETNSAQNGGSYPTKKFKNINCLVNSPSLAEKKTSNMMEAEYGLGNHGWGVERN